MANAPGRLDFVIYQGVPFDETLTYLAGDEGEPLLPVDLSGCQADLTARLPDDLQTDAPRLHLTTQDGGIVLNETLGSIRFVFEDTVDIWWDDKAAAYDLDVTFPGRPKRRLLLGTITISKEQRV